MSVFDENRRDIITSKESFTMNEILAEYSKKTKQNILDGIRSVPGFIKDLVELNVIRFEKGRYYTK